MSTDADQPNIGEQVSPGWHIDTEPDGSGWHRWTATELTSGKTASGPAASLAVILLILVLLVSALVDGDDAVKVYRSDGVWVARHTEVGVASQGQSRQAALANLEEAVSLHLGQAGKRIETEEEERAVLRDLGIDPDEVTEESKDLPEFIQ